MSKRPELYVVATPSVKGWVAPLRPAPTRNAAPIATSPREASWRNLMRRLAKFPVKG